MKQIVNALQNLVFGNFRYLLTEKQLKNTKTF